MKGIKKGHATAKQHDLNIGNQRITGLRKVHVLHGMCNAKRDGRNLALLAQQLISGLSTLEHVFKALESMYQPFFNQDFKNSFDAAIRGACNE